MTLETGGVNEFIYHLYYSIERPPKRGLKLGGSGTYPAGVAAV